MISCSVGKVLRFASEGSPAGEGTRMLSDWLPFLIYAIIAAVIPATMVDGLVPVRDAPDRRGRSSG